MPMQISAKVIADTIPSSIKRGNSARITSLELVLPRFILAQLNTHRVFSRSTASSRAIPVSKTIQQVEDDPFIPKYWGKNQHGMQAKEEISEPEKAKELWLKSAENAVENAKKFVELGCHKQTVNRILEPYMWGRTIVTATEWENFFKLRLYEDSQPEMQELALAMRNAIDNSTPKVNYMHLPYINSEFIDEKFKEYAQENGLDVHNLDSFNTYQIYHQLAMISSARCARVSYLNHDSTEPDEERDLALANTLLISGHFSPFEHCAMYKGTLVPDFPKECQRNFKNWVQFRGTIDTTTYNPYLI